MYILDPLYGKIEFSQLIYKCMLSPEVQRLREVRLCNINSLCITGSANINRFEHSVGTAYLASINIDSMSQRQLKLSEKKKETFIIAALLHDVANGPFGHSYEYIMEKKGFIPEQGLDDVFTDIGSVGKGAHSNTSPFETIYFGKLRSLTSILNDGQKKEISSIISGKHFLSKLISDRIDLDNIDNVFRMAYHMGIDYTKEAPRKLAMMMYLKKDEVFFEKEAVPYLNEWYSVRQKVYKFLLLNPQEFAGKYMLTEAMDILFECIAQGKEQERDIKWNYTDYQLMEELDRLNEVWIKRKTLLLENDNTDFLAKIVGKVDKSDLRQLIKEYVEGLQLTTTIKKRGVKGETDRLVLSENFSCSDDGNNTLSITNRNVDYEVKPNGLYRVLNIRYNPSQIVSRLMTGDLYYCLMIMETAEIEKYQNFLEYEKRINIEDEIVSKIRTFKEFSSIIIGIHPILDVNKTERQLHINIEGLNHTLDVGYTSSRKMLLGIFIKNEPYGLKHMKLLSENNYDKLVKIVSEYFASYFTNGAKVVPLYEEADKYG